jgi:type VI secretion system secreted protein VgrG
MDSVLEPSRKLIADSKGTSARQEYFLDVPGSETAQLSIISVDAIEMMGAPNEVRVALTSPVALLRKDYLNRDASVSLNPLYGSSRKFSGFIASVSKIKTTADFTRYELVVKSHLARLEAVKTSRIYQHQSTPEIIEAILRRHGLLDHQFVFKLRRQYPQLLFRFQYCQDDLSYVQLLMQKTGIYCYTVETEYGDQVVFGDDIDHYIYEPEIVAPYREVSGLNAATEAVFELSTHAQTVPRSFLVAEYNPEHAYERFRDEANIAPNDSTTYGTTYVFGTNHVDQQGAIWEAQLRHEAAIAHQVVFNGRSTVSALHVGCVLHTDAQLLDAPEGLLITGATHRGARDKAYSNTFKAIPAERRFRLQLEEDKWPKIAGSISARVTSPDKYKYAYLTAAGYYTVRFDLDFEDWPAGGESVPLRLAKPFAGALQTGFHFPALDGAEAIVQFRDGDPDKPYIAGFHHHSQAVDLVTSDRRWLSRNVIRTQPNNKLRMEDWQGQEGIKLSTEHSGKSQLNLGYLVDSKLEQRGEGFELRTSGHGAIRGGKGVYLTAYDQPGVSGKQLDMQQTVAQLEQALELARSLADSARAARAAPADVEAQQNLNRELDGLTEAGLLASAPASIGLVAGGGVHVAAQDHISAVAGKSVDISAMRRFTLAAGDLVSIFAQKLGIKVFAAKGPIEIQAQSDAMALAADKDVTVASVNGALCISAKKELTLECGGAFVQLKDGNITIGGPLDLFLKVITIQKQGKETLQLPTAELPAPQYNERFQIIDHETSNVLSNRRYAIQRANGTMEYGVTDQSGRTHLLSSTANQEDVNVFIQAEDAPKQQSPARGA